MRQAWWEGILSAQLLLASVLPHAFFCWCLRESTLWPYRQGASWALHCTLWTLEASVLAVYPASQYPPDRSRLHKPKPLCVRPSLAPSPLLSRILGGMKRPSWLRKGGGGSCNFRCWLWFSLFRSSEDVLLPLWVIVAPFLCFSAWQGSRFYLEAGPRQRAFFVLAPRVYSVEGGCRLWSGGCYRTAATPSHNCDLRCAAVDVAFQAAQTDVDTDCSPSQSTLVGGQRQLQAKLATRLAFRSCLLQICHK